MSGADRQGREGNTHVLVRQNNLLFAPLERSIAMFDFCCVVVNVQVTRLSGLQVDVFLLEGVFVVEGAHACG